MNCLPCFQNDDEDEEGNDNNNNNQPTPTKADTQAQTEAAKEAASSSNAKAFTFRELAMATKNFRQECLLGEGGFGRVFKGKLHSTGQVVAVKQLDRNNMQGNNEFMVEILMLSLLQHPNLVSLIGYCADGDQRLLVYEYLEMGNLERHLFGDHNPEKQPMDWYTRMKIAAGAAQGLEYLHEKANPPIIYRDLKPSNILLDDNYEPKLSDCGLAKLGGGGGTMNPASRVMGTYGYSAPEYSSSGELTLKSDMYSFGVVLLELITGRRVIDTTRPNDEQNLVTWAQPIFREPKRFPDLADPRLNNEFPVTSLNQAVGICAMCLQEEPSVRPLVEDVVAALSFLGVPQPNATHFSAQAGKDASPSTFSPPPEQKMHYGDDDANQGPVSQPDDNKSNQDRNSDSDDNKSNHEESSSSDESDNEGGDNEGGDRESISEQQNTEGVQSSAGVESGRLSERQNSDDSEEEGTYSGSGSGDESSNYDDAENTEFDNSETTNPSEGGSSKSDAGNLSSKHGSSRRSSSPTKRTGSRRRKMVVTFKEPSKSSIRSTSKKEKQEENNSENQPVTPEDGQQKSSSESSSSSSDSEDDEQQKFARHQKGQKRREASSSMDDNEQRVLDGVHEDGPKLRHLQTR